MSEPLSLRSAVRMLVQHELEEIRHGAPVGSPRERADRVASVFDHVPNNGMVERATRAWLLAEFGEDADADNQWPRWAANVRAALAAALGDRNPPA